MLTIRTCVALVLLVVVLLPNTFKIVTILEIHTDGLVQQQQQQQVNVGGRKVTSPPQPPASVPGGGSSAEGGRWRSNEEILLEFMSHLKQNDPKAIAIHKEYQSTNNSTQFLRATRDFLLVGSSGNQPPPPAAAAATAATTRTVTTTQTPPPPAADVGNDKCRNLLQHNNMRKTRTLIVFSGPSAKTEAKHKLYEQNMEYFLTRGGVPKGDSCCNPRDGIGNGPNYDSSIDNKLQLLQHHHHRQQQQQQQLMLYDTVLVVGHEYYDSTRARVQQWKDEQVANHNNNTCFEREHQKLLVAARDPQCYDMETARLAIHSLLGVQMSDYDYLVYVNCGMTGPFGPKKKNAAAAASSNNNNNNNNADNLLGPWNGLDPWPTVLTSRIDHRVKMTGLSINTYDIDGRSNQPHIQSFLYAMDQVGIQVVKDAKAVFDCRSKVYRSSHAMVLDVIDRYEIGMSRAILSRGYAIQPLLDYYNCTTVTRTQLLCRAWDMWYEDKLRQFLPPESFRDGTLLERSFFVKSSRFLPLHPSSAPIFGTVAKTAFNASTTPSDWTLTNQKSCRCVHCDDDDLCGGLWHANRFQPLDFDEPQHKLRLHLVVSHCKKDLSWITSGFIPPSYHNNIKSVHVITKCGEDVTGEPPNSTILFLPNVGRCDHSYAYYILNLLDEVVLTSGDNEQDGANNSVVLFLKDDMSAENFHQEGGWNDFESIVRVASSTNGFACGVETSAVASAYHETEELFNFRMAAYDHKKDLYGEGDVEFKSNYSDLGAFYLDVVVGGMGSAAAAGGSGTTTTTTTTTSRPPPPPPPVPPPLPGLVQVCYGGVFAASYPNIRKVDRSVWERIEKTLSRGNSIEEGHHMERSWAMLLATPLRSFQVEAVRKYGRPRTFEESEFQPGILEAIPQRQQQQHGRRHQHVQTSPVLQHFHRTRPHRVTTRKHFRDMEKFHMGGDAGNNAPTTNTGKRFRENRAGGGGTATTTATTKPTSTSHKRVVEGGGSLPARHFLTKPTTTTSAVAEKRDHSWMRKISKPT